MIMNRYGRQGVNLFRTCERLDLKARKLRCDKDFLTKCIQNNLTPKFIQFKLSIPNFRNDHDYKIYQRKLLQKELMSKRLATQIVSSELDQSRNNIKSLFTLLESNHSLCVIDSINCKKEAKFTYSQKRKLLKLGLTHQYDALEPDSVIFNRSSRILTDVEKETLALGLKYCFSPPKINFVKYFSAFEQLYCNISQHSIYRCFPDAINYFRTSFKAIALQKFYSFKPRISQDQKNRVETCRGLAQDKSIVITKPDKGNGVVILDKHDYVSKMNTILSDPTKFTPFRGDIYKKIIALQDSLNRLIESFKKLNLLTNVQVANLRATGSRPGIVYGSPKVHKPGTPLRPILSTIGTYNYNLSKFLVKLLHQSVDMTFVIRDTFSFVNKINSFENKNYFMATFDVKSLFTNIPIKETNNIILDKCSQILIR